MKITKLRTNHFTTPLGHTLGKPVFSWVTTETESKKQTAAQVVVTAGGETLWDSGRREDLSSLGVEADLALQPRTRYDWTVTVWGDGGDSATASSWFETAKEDEPWQARWITADFPDKETQPLLAKTFSLKEKPVCARAYACGLGLYELEVNGAKVGDEYLLPGFHCYYDNLEYQTFDLTDALTAGDNAIGLHLGPGWYMGEIVFDRYKDLWGDKMQAICEVRVTTPTAARRSWAPTRPGGPPPPRSPSAPSTTGSTTTPGRPFPAGAPPALPASPPACGWWRRSGPWWPGSGPRW